MTTLKKFWLLPVAAILWIIVVCVVTATGEPDYVFILSDQKSGQVILERAVAPGDRLTLRLTHSFEHIPWNEYYIIQTDGSVLLSRIEVGGYGAGIPAEMEVPTYIGDDGLVHMDEINSVFAGFNWITSRTNMRDLALNDETILSFSQLPHHSFIHGEIQIKRRMFFHGERNRGRLR